MYTITIHGLTEMLSGAILACQRPNSLQFFVLYPAGKDGTPTTI